MRRFTLCLLAGIASAACQSGAGGTTGSPAQASSTSAGSSASGGTGSGISTGSSASNTGGKATGSASGAPPCTWIGGACVPSSCKGQPLAQPCALPVDAIGACLEGACTPVDFQTDPQNCGGFGDVCPQGDCVPFEGLGSCEGFCAPDFLTCPGNLACSNGVCVLPSCTAANGGLACATDAGGSGACCGSACTDVHGFDPKNCGDCGRACPSGDVCSYGYCLPAADCATHPGAACGIDGGSATGLCCDGRCVDSSSDPQNCYGCGEACAAGATCTGGSCSPFGCSSDARCEQGYACVAGGFLCAPTTCGVGSDGDICASGSTDDTCCGQSCIDTSIDNANCGGCGIACPAGAACVSGRCSPLGCFPGLACGLDGGAAGACCTGSCADLRDDPANCGGCGVGCPAGASCSDGGCQSNGTPDACTADGDCASGRACVAGACLAATCNGASGDACAAAGDGGPFSGICCGGTCQRTATDPSNCGGCAQVCPAGEDCQGGVCFFDGGPALGCPVPCPFGSQCAGTYCQGVCALAGSDMQLCSLPVYGFEQGHCCGGICVDTYLDPSDCAVCGNVCASGICSPDFADCLDAQPASGCLQSCAQGNACDGLYCVDGQCPSADGRCLAKDETIADCCADNQCPDLLIDTQNCGQCGVACPSGQTCQRGACSGSPECPGSENGNYCNPDAGLQFRCCAGAGCVDVTSDSNDCGGCDNVCPAGEKCQSGQCQ